MAINNFIPTVWAGSILRNLNKALVYGQIGVVNRDYEGEIRDKGDSVKINSLGPVTVFDYVKNTNMGDPETLTDAQQTLSITQSKAFNFQVDDVDKAQQTPKVMNAASENAAYALADVTDQYIANLYTGVAAGNTIGTDGAPVTPTAATAYELLVDLAVKLTTANVPRQNRWVVVPPWYEGYMLKDNRFVKYDEPLLNGAIARAAGFDILVSNNVPNTGGVKYKIIGGYPGAISLADQINKTEAYSPEKRFADAVKGLHLFGGKLVRPTGIAVLTANPS